MDSLLSPAVSLLAPMVWESKSALLAHLTTSESQTLLLGQDAETPRAYHSFSVASGGRVGDIGVISSGLGTRPAAAVFDRGQRVLIGCDLWITWIDVESIAVLTSRGLGGVFYELLPSDRDDEIVVLHELGALRVAADGAVIWSVDSDVVEESVLDGKGNLVLATMDGRRLIVSLGSGAVRGG